MSTLSRQNLKRWISDALEGFKAGDLLGVSDSWMQIYDALADYISGKEEVDNNLLWMIEGTDETLPDVIYQLQRLKNALVKSMVEANAADQITQLLTWFDRLIVVLVEKDSGKMSRERGLSKPFETIFWKARDGMYISTMEGRFLHCNEALMKMLRFESLEDTLSMDIANDLYVDKQERQIMLDHLMKDGFFDHHDFRFRTQDNEERTAMESCYIVQAPGGKQYIVGIMVDVSKEKEEQRRAEQYVKGIEKSGMETLLNLRRKTRRFEALLGLNDHPVLMMDPKEFNLFSCNKAFTKRFKLGRKQLNNYAFRDLFTSEEWMRVFTQISQSAHRHHYHIRNVTLSPQEGNDFTADLSLWVHEDDEGAILFIQIEDRGELLNIKRLLERSKQNVEDLLSNLPVGVIGFKSDGNVGLINRYLMEFTGYTSRQLRNMSFLNRLFARDEQRLKFQKYIRRFTQGNHAENVTIELKARGGEILQFKLTTLSYQFPADDKPGFLAILNNVTDKVSLERMLADQARQPASLADDYRNLEEGLANIQDALEGLRRKNRFRQKFIDVVTEKFKTPIHVVLGYASLLRKELRKQLDKSQLEDMGIIETQIGNVLIMLEKSIEFANLDADKVNVEEETLGARTMLDQLFERLQPKRLPEGVTYQKEHQILSLDVTVDVDKSLLENMLRHVIDNAVSFTPQGSITLSAYEERGRLWIEVQDTGCGISPTDMPQVFEPFFQGSDALSKEPRMGLGLAIAQHYADLADMSIEIFSRLSEGTRFVICVGLLEDKSDDVPKMPQGVIQTEG